MNSINQRNLRLRAVGAAKVAITLLFIVALFVPMLSAQVAPAGAVIGNQATATYTDGNGVSRETFSNLVQTSVTQIFKATLTPVNSKYATPGTQVIFPHVYTNTGNGPDTFTLGTAAVSASLSNVHIYLDSNGDGIPNNTTDISGTSEPIAAGASFKYVVVATLNAGTAAGAYTLEVTGTSGGGGAGVVTGASASNYAIDTVTESNNGVINVTKAMSASGVGGISTVTLTYTNTGNATALNVAIIDDLVAQGTNFTYCKGATVATCGSGTGSATWNGVAFTDASAPTGLTWANNTPAGGVTATVASIAPGVTGTITYNLLVATPASYPATFTNYAKYNYNDGSGTTVPAAASYINTNIVSLAFNGAAYVKFTGTTPAGQYTAGTGTPPALNTTPDTNIIPSASYNQGATISWTQTITNKGQITDTYNLVLDTVGAGTTLDPSIVAASQFPAGTVFQLYRADGRTPLTDTNGDGIIDAGPETAAGTSTIVVTATLPPGTQVSSATTFIVNVVATSTNATASNFATPGIQDVIQDEVIIASTKNAAVDLYANATDTIGTGKGTSGETAGPYSGNPGSIIAVPFWVGNTGTNSAPDSYYLSFMYDGTAAVGNIVTVTPFTAAQSGTVPPAIGTTIPAWTVLVAPNTGANCSTYGAPVTASSVIAAAGNVEYCLLLQVPASYSANTYHFTIQAQSNSTGAIDQMAVQASVNTYHNVSISPNNQATAYAGGTVTYKHVITNGGNVTETNTITLNAPTLQATPTGWTIATYANTDGSGTLDSSSASVTTPTTITLAPGASVTYFQIVQAPASANPGDVQVDTWTITVPGNATTAATSVTDTTTVVSGQLKLVKAVKLDTACSIAQASWTAQAYVTTPTSATSQQCIIYQIQATNTGTTAVTVLNIADSAPPYTAINGTVLENVPAAGCTGLATGAVTTSGSSFTAPFTGTVPPGCVASVYFEVKLN